LEHLSERHTGALGAAPQQAQLVHQVRQALEPAGIGRERRRILGVRRSQCVAAVVCQYLSKIGKTPGRMILPDYTLNNAS
jgi:hypothetical protein